MSVYVQRVFRARGDGTMVFGRRVSFRSCDVQIVILDEGGSEPVGETEWEACGNLTRFDLPI